MSENLDFALQAAIDRQRETLEIPGISAAVIFPDESIWYGVSGKSSDFEALNSSMFFGLGSVTKTYIAVIVLQLVQEGSLSIDDPVGKWLDDMDQIYHEITVRQLLNHTSGLHRYQITTDYLETVNLQPEKVWTTQEILNRFTGEPECQPGECWGESAMDYVLLGMIIEKITGSSVLNQLQTRIFEPLELENTYFYPEQKYPVEKMAHMWWDVAESGEPIDVVTGGEEMPLAALFSSLWASGAMHSTAADLVRFVKDLFDGKLFDEGLLEEMVSPGLELYPGAHYGFSVIIDHVNDQTVYWHSGGAGYSSIYYYFPEDGLSIAVLCNLMIDPKPIADALFAAYVDYQKE